MSPTDDAAVQEALRAVRVAGEACPQAADTEAAKAALQRVRMAAVKAIDLIKAAEKEAADAEWDAMIRRQVQRMESMA